MKYLVPGRWLTRRSVVERLLDSWQEFKARLASARQGSRRRDYRPWLVQLEDRLAPAVVSFGTPPAITNNTNGLQVYAADLDSDGDLDILSASPDDDTIAWHENNGAAIPSFTPRTIAIDADGAASVYAADLDGDGDTDVLSASINDDTIAWYENDGTPADGGWTTHAITITADGANWVHAADVDGDGDTDVLATSELGDRITWYENNGATDPAFDERVIDPNANAPVEVSTADVDGDGDIDVLAAIYSDNTIAWYENNGAADPGFTMRTIATDANGAESVHAADVDGDGDLDVLSASAVDDKIAWYENDGTPGDGGWTPHVLTLTADGAESVYAGDVDGDGDLDVVSASENDDEIAWYENNGQPDPTFTMRAVATSDGANSVYAADVDGDGDLDVLSSSSYANEVAWYRNDTIHRSAVFETQPPISTTSDAAHSVYTADLDGDGDLDVLAASTNDNEIAWYENDGATSPTFAPHIIDTSNNGPISVHAADVDGDGDLDVLAATLNDNKILWYENNGAADPSFDPRTIATDAVGARRVHAADLDNDGDLDVLSASLDDDKIVWYENDGATDPAFAPRIITTSANGVRSMVPADVDGDGDIDILATSIYDDTVAWYENNGAADPIFNLNTIATNLDVAFSVFAADLDDDGDLDVLFSAAGVDNKIGWYENNGEADPTFTLRAVGTPRGEVYATDVDSDGDMDILAAAAGNTIVWYENNGAADPSFDPRTIATNVLDPYWVHAADLDSDGDMDVLSASETDDTIAWYKNRGGQFALATTNTAPATLRHGQTDDLLSIVMTHRGRTGDHAEELTTLDLLFEESAGDPLSSAEANALIENLHIFRDANGNGTFDPATDTLVITVPNLVLTAGRQTVSFTDGDANVQVIFGTPVTFFVVAELTGNAAAQTPRQFRVTHVTESSSTAEDAAADLPLRLEVVANVSTGILQIVNDPPVVANPIPDQTFTGAGGHTFQFAANAFTDPDAGDTLTYSATLQNSDPLPNWLTFTPATRTFSGNPSVGNTTPLQIRVTASDGSSSVFDDFQLTLSNVNDTPTVANPITDQTFTGPGNHTFQFAANTFADADALDTLTYSATRTDGSMLPLWLTFTAATRTFSGNPSVGDTTPLQIRVTANDGNSGTVFDDFQLTLSNVNDTPTVANPILDQTFTGAGGHTFQFAANTFADADALDTLTYSATRADGSLLPQWLTFTPATRTFSGNPSVSDTTPVQIRVTANDGNGGTVFDDFQLTLTNVNDTPTVANVIPDQTFTGPGTKTFQFAANTFADADALDTLSYTVMQVGGAELPPWLSFTAATRTFSGNPSVSDTTPLQIRVTANDGNGGTVFDDFQLTLNNVNDGPVVANPIPDGSLSGPGTPSYQFPENTFTDADALDTLNYTVMQVGGAALPAWLTFTSATRTISGNPSVSDTTPLQIRVTATDGHGDPVFDDFQLTLNNVNDTPIVLNAIPDQTFTGAGGHSFQFAANTFADADALDTLSYTSMQVGGAALPDWLTFTSATRTFSGNPSVSDTTPLQIRVTANDGNGGTVFDDFQLTLTNVNDTPTVANSIPDQTFTGSGTKTFQFDANTFADADALDTHTYTAMQAGGAALPPWLNFTAATRTFSGNPSVSDTTPLQIRVTANDGNGGTVFDDFQLTLNNVNDTPTVANLIPDQSFTGPGNHTFQFAANTFADADALDTLTYSATRTDGSMLPLWLTFTAATRTFSGNPSVSDITPLQIRVTANDGNSGTVFDDFQLTLSNVNDTPTVANPILDQTFTGAGGHTFQFPANTFADSDALDTLSYTATRADGSALPDWLTFTPATRTFSGNPSVSDTTPVQIRVTANDGNGGTVFDDFQLTLTNVNDTPTVANVIPDQTFTGPGTKTFQFAANTFADADALDTLGFSATLVGGAPLPAWLTFNAATRTFSGNPRFSDTTPLQIRVSADDGNGGIVTEDFQLTLNNVSDGVRVQLVTKKVGKKKKLFVQIFFVETGEMKREFVSPFQKPKFKRIVASALDTDGDGAPETIELSARKGNNTVIRTFPA